MSLALRREPRLRFADFLAMTRARPDEERWKLLDGEPVPMAPQGERHRQIVSTLIRRIGSLAGRLGCRALPGLGSRNEFVDDDAPIPDPVVRCGPLLADGSAGDPLLAAEVLSPSALHDDRGRKAALDPSLQTLRSFLIVDRDEPRVEVWPRGNGPNWTLRALGLDDVIDLPDLAGRVPVASLHAGLHT
ncbi:Uma2 family endonuclease [Methylobacterium sp. ID0610]|uniref:Uma2 family endonuclease n=1 Tax=Methylobacterium carpenticola TaxID=3344827 RepID=UPI0036BEFB6F